MEYNNVGKLTFISSDRRLNDGFAWAKEQALAYAHMGEDRVGLWYEAALPERDAFCMRDVSHQIYGASVLGLQEHTKNILMKFAEHISESRDYCTYWEITKEGKPCPDDYIDDGDFWYNLPGSFELIRACYHQYLWTGDRDYLEHPVFMNYYEKTCNELVQHWDRDGDGILEYYEEYGRRGLASYNECDGSILTAGDMIASQYTGYDSYSKILRLSGQEDEARLYEARRDRLKEIYLNEWYDEAADEFYGAVMADGSFYKGYYKEGNFLPIHFGILDGEDRLRAAINQLKEHGVHNVEGQSYLPQIYFEHGEPEAGMEALLALCDPQLYRREYPEVSYALTGTVARQLMGIGAGEDGIIFTQAAFVEERDWGEITGVPVRAVEIDVRHSGTGQTTFRNRSDKVVKWKAMFNGAYKRAESQDGNLHVMEHEQNAAGTDVSFVVLEVAPWSSCTVCVKCD